MIRFHFILLLILINSVYLYSQSRLYTTKLSKKSYYYTSSFGNLDGFWFAVDYNPKDKLSYVKYTIDDGQSWRLTEERSIFNLFSYKELLWHGVIENNIYKLRFSNNIGSTWKTIYVGNLILNDLFFVNDKIGYASVWEYGFNGKKLIYKSFDGGKSWEFLSDINKKEFFVENYEFKQADLFN